MTHSHFDTAGRCGGSPVRKLLSQQRRLNYTGSAPKLHHGASQQTPFEVALFMPQKQNGQRAALAKTIYE